jgi:hypothetical protein
LQLTIELEFGLFGREQSSAGHRRTHQYATMPMTRRGVLRSGCTAFGRFAHEMCRRTRNPGGAIVLLGPGKKASAG